MRPSSWLSPIVLFVVVLGLTPSGGPSAATPQTIKVQGSLTDRASGNPLPAQGTYNMTFALFDAEFGGLPITTIGPLAVDVQQGRFQVDLPLSTGQFQLPDRYLQITVGGETLTPRVRLTSAPFALVSDQAATAATASTSNTAAVAMNVAAGAVGTSGLLDGSVTAPKLGIPCATGEILLRGAAGWTCAPAPGGVICDAGAFVSCYTGPAGTLGVGRCRAGVSACNAAGTAFQGCTGQTLPSAETCDNSDNDCDGSVDEGNICQSCPDADHDGYPAANCGGTDCNDTNAAVHPGAAEICDTFDNDCNPATPNGSADPQSGTPCDGNDADLCLEGTKFCTAQGVMACNDVSSSTLDVCNGIDDDCDPSSPDGSEDQFVSTACDGPDSDHCAEGIYQCTNGSLVCTDETNGSLDLCNGLDDDCDAASADGSEDPMVGAPCDGPDADFCDEGVYSCSGGSLACSDHTGATLEICGNGVDDDCDGDVDEGC